MADSVGEGQNLLLYTGNLENKSVHNGGSEIYLFNCINVFLPVASAVSESATPNCNQ